MKSFSMKDLKNILKGIKGVFKPPRKVYYLGKIRYYTPYFEPRNFSRSILRIRKLKPLSKEKLEENDKRGYGWPNQKYSNLPMIRRSKDWIIRLFGNDYWIQIGRPWAVVNLYLGWKDKFQSVRYEWSPSFQLWFFKWQFCIHWAPPKGIDVDSYWEQILWYLYYYETYGSDKPNIKLAEEKWPWQDGKTKISTWDKNALL